VAGRIRDGYAVSKTFGVLCCQFHYFLAAFNIVMVSHGAQLSFDIWDAEYIVAGSVEACDWSS